MKTIKSEILILGGDSRLGQSIKLNFKKNNIHCISTTKNKKKITKTNIFFDLNNYQDFEVPKNIKVVYFCASITSIDFCEKEKKLSNDINVDKTCKLINIFLRLKIHVIYFSTNLIFNGHNNPFSHLSKFSPQNEYALQKTRVENYLNNQKYKTYSIIRFGKIIFKDDNLLLNWIKNIKKNLKFCVARNKFISPIYYSHAIDIIKKITLNHEYGTYQISAIDSISYLEIAKFFLKVLKKNDLIELIKLKKTNNPILISNIKGFKFINSKEVIKKFLSENGIV